MLAGGLYNNESVIGIKVDSAGRLILAPEIASAADVGATLVSSDALEASRVLKASGGVLLALHGYNDAGSAQYIQLFDANAVPADDEVPLYTFAVAAGSNFTLPLGALGLPFSTGIVVCNSSTPEKKTIGSADCFFTALIK